MNKPTLAIVGTVGLPANYGGWETLVSNILPQLVEDFDVTVFCSAKRYDEQPKTYGSAELDYVNFDANGIQSIPYDIVNMWRARKHDAMLILGVSGCLTLPFFRLISRSALILNIDGLEWKRDKWSKLAKSFLWLSERIGVAVAHGLIADNKVIQDYIRYIHKKESTLIAYGGDWHYTDQDVSMEADEDAGLLSGDYAVTVCRIEPENNIHVILEGFSTLNYPLIVFGNWQSSQYGKDLFRKYNGVGKIRLKGPLYNRAALDRYRANCTMYVHGHSAGGTNPSLVEAMWLDRTVACFDVSFNRETTEGKAFYFQDIESLQTVAQQVFEEGKSNATTLKSIADRRYTWAKVAQDYSHLIGGLCSGSPE